MRKYLTIIIGIMLFGLVACGTNSTMDEANGEEKNGEGLGIETLIEQLNMDATIDTSSERAKFNFSLKNTGEKLVTLGFNSSQKYEVEVTNDKGENVYTFSNGKVFTQELTTDELPQGEKLAVSESWIKNVEPGEYEATIRFLVTSINDQPLEANPFEINQSFTIPEVDPDEKNSSDQTPEPGEAFRHLEIKGEKGNYTVTGEARVFEGTFMYSVEDGHNVIIEPTSVQVSEGAPAWSDFEIKVNIPEKELPDYGNLTMTLFEESAENGEPTNMQYLPLDQFESAE